MHTQVFEEIKKSLKVSIWFMFLTFPIMVLKVNVAEKTIIWRWKNLILVGIGSFFLSILWRYLLERKAKKTKKEELGIQKTSIFIKLFTNPKYSTPLYISFLLFILIFPFVFSMYQTNIMISALIYVMLGLGLNIVVGLAGLLDLGYVAFYAVGAYSYALLNYHFHIGFWTALPIGGFLAALFGIVLGFPVLRLRGDYLAIVTLGFGEIIRLILENWDEFSFGPSGISNIPRPTFFGMDLGVKGSTIFIYYIIVAMALITIFVVNRLQNSRLGRAWLALREDEIACQAMGIDKTKTKLTAFALGAMWAGFGGVVFAAKTTFINPASFTFLESAIILSIVVLGGMGSIQGVILAALVMILLPEYLRAFSNYRMLIFGASMVLMMVFRPEGLIPSVRRKYQYHPKETEKIG